MTTKTVDEYLNDVSYDDILHYVPSLFALEFVNFIKLVNGVDGTENKTPPVHYKIIDSFATLDDVINLCHRGMAKSTLKEYLIFFIAVYGELGELGDVPYGIYVSDSIDNGVKKMRNSLEFRYSNSEFLQTYLPHVKFTDIRWEFVNKTGHSLVVSAYGAKTGVRGTRENNSRPVLALLDDLVSDEDAESAAIIAKIENTVTKAIEFALHPTKRKIVWSGTPFNQRDPLYKAADSGAWHVNAYPVCEKFPCTREEFRGSWEDRFPYDYVKRMYDKAKQQGKLNSFNQELMLRIMSEEDRLVLDSDINWYRAADLMEQRGNYNFYITTDFTTSEKKSADFSVIKVWAYNHNKDWFLVDGECKRQSLDKSIDSLFRFCAQYRPLEVGIEVTGQQGGFIPWINKEMITRNCFFTILQVRPNVSKFQRFLAALPIIKLRKVYFPSDRKDLPVVVEAESELSLVTSSGIKSRHDDCLDNISMLPLLSAFEPSVTTEMTYNKADDIWESLPDNEDFSGYSGYIV